MSDQHLKLVTGAPGWLGTRLARILVDGLPDVDAFGEGLEPDRIRCLVLPTADQAGLNSISEKLDLHRGDLRDDEAVRTFCAGAEGGTLFHCAGVVHPQGRIQEFYEVNLEGTRRVLEAAEAAGVRRAVIVSSIRPSARILTASIDSTRTPRTLPT